MAPAAKLKPRPHGRKKIAQNEDAGVTKRRDAAIVAFDLAFRARLPQHEASGQFPHSSGSYVQVAGDVFDGKDYPIADGRYRVQGSDWIHGFEGGGFVEAQRAQPPDYGGKSVIAIAPGNG